MQNFLPCFLSNNLCAPYCDPINNKHASCISFAFWPNKPVGHFLDGVLHSKVDSFTSIIYVLRSRLNSEVWWTLKIVSDLRRGCFILYSLRSVHTVCTICTYNARLIPYNKDKTFPKKGKCRPGSQNWHELRDKAIIPPPLSWLQRYNPFRVIVTLQVLIFINSF